MSRYVYILFVLFLTSVGLHCSAQEFHPVPRRTAEERAMKQTEMLVRDLMIQDSVMRDTIYRVHLRYARTRERVTNRMQAVESMNRLLAELKGILSAEQYERLLSIPRRHGARNHRAETDSLDQQPTLPKQ